MLTTVALHGEIDVQTAPVVLERLRQAVEDNLGGTVLVDMTHVSFIDSSGLGALVAATKRALSDNTEIRIGEIPMHLRQVFAVTGLDKVLARPAATG